MTGSWDEGLRQDLQESRGLENLGNRRRGQDCRSQSQWMRRRGPRWRRRRSARHRAASQSRRVMAERGSAETGRWTSDAETTERQIGDGETTGGGGGRCRSGCTATAGRRCDGGGAVIHSRVTTRPRRGRCARTLVVGESRPGENSWVGVGHASPWTSKRWGNLARGRIPRGAPAQGKGGDAPVDLPFQTSPQGVSFFQSTWEVVQ